MDMHAMIAAAQNHMQKNLTAKMASIGVPMSAFGMATGDGGQRTDPDTIPLPEDPMGVDMGIADVEIPLPIGGVDDDRPPLALRPLPEWGPGTPCWAGGWSPPHSPEDQICSA